MSSLAEYFEKNRPKPVWHIGDRVFGRWQGVPFIGTVGNDNMVSELIGPRVSVFLDLPFIWEGQQVNIVFVKQNEIVKLRSFDEEPEKKSRKSVD